jgi:hypothetical protein
VRFKTSEQGNARDGDLGKLRWVVEWVHSGECSAAAIACALTPPCGSFFVKIVIRVILISKNLRMARVTRISPCQLPAPGLPLMTRRARRRSACRHPASAANTVARRARRTPRATGAIRAPGGRALPCALRVQTILRVDKRKSHDRRRRRLEICAQRWGRGEHADQRRDQQHSRTSIGRFASRMPSVGGGWGCSRALSAPSARAVRPAGCRGRSLAQSARRMRY